MDSVTFLVKHKVLVKKTSSDVLHVVKVFDALSSTNRIYKLENADFMIKGYSVQDCIKHFLRDKKDFQYKHYNVFFAFTDALKF